MQYTITANDETEILIFLNARRLLQALIAIEEYLDLPYELTKESKAQNIKIKAKNEALWNALKHLEYLLQGTNYEELKETLKKKDETQVS